MTPTVDLTETQILLTLGDWIADVLGTGVEVTRSQLNLVSAPAGPFVTMTPLSRIRLSTSEVRYQDQPGLGRRFVKSKREFVVQIDVYGEDASDRSETVATLFNDENALLWFTRLGSPVRPLFADEPRQAVFMNEKAQYEDRWSVDLHLQTNIEIATSQEFADQLEVNLVQADTL